MIIRAARPEAHFVMVRNAVARDTNLSFRARGVLIAVLSRPDDWSISAENLAREGQESVQTIYKVLRELEVAGYVQRRRKRNELGQIRTETIVFDEPQLPTDKKPADGEPKNGETDSRLPVSVTKTDKQKQITKTETQTGATAKAIAQGWWEAQEQKPLQSFIALVKVVERAVKAGYETERIEGALAGMKMVPTVAQLEASLKGIRFGKQATGQTAQEIAARKHLDAALAKINRERGTE